MNTGFNSINVPDSEQTLQSAASSYKDFPAIDCLQRYFLNSIVIRAFEDDVIQGDYIKLWDDQRPTRFAFYSMSGYTMTSGDTVDLNITMDPLLTCGGVDNIDFLDGMTSRHHIGSQDEGQDITEEDPYLIPKKIYKIGIGECYGRESGQRAFVGQGDFILIITSCYNLDSNAKIELQPSVKFETSESGSTEGLMTTTPILDDADINYNITPIMMGYDTVFGDNPICDGKGYYAVTKLDANDRIFKRLSKLIAYGRSDVITDAYFVPRIYLDSDAIQVDSDGGFISRMNLGDKPKLFIHSGNDVFVPYLFVSDNCNVDDLTGSVIGAYDVTLYNASRIAKGKHFAYTYLCKESGEIVDVNPEDTTNPSDVRVNVDPRRTGQVNYYIPNKRYYPTTDSGEIYVHNEGDDSCYTKIGGKNWDGAALTTMASAGSFLEAQTAAAQSNLKDVSTLVNNMFNVNSGAYGSINPANIISSDIENYQMHLAGADASGAGRFVSGVTGLEAATLGYKSANNNISYSMANYASQAIQGNEYAKAYTDRAIERASEQRAIVNNSIPQTQVVSSSSGNNVMTGYGLIVFRSIISKEDVLRFDRILNQFGWKITEPIKKAFLKNRRDYNYIDASGVSIKCDTVPKSVRNDLANLFNGGVRIWHKKPYTDYSVDNGYKEV